MGGTIYAHRPDRAPALLATVDAFNLTSMDGAELLHVSPPGNLVSVRSQEESLYEGAYHHYSINRFDFVVEPSSLMRLFVES